jgi:hypothetical protein
MLIPIMYYTENKELSRMTKILEGRRNVRTANESEA